MPTFKLDGKEIPFEPGDSIIKAAAKQGVEIPHYCWHPGLSAPANCRMCLVEIKPAAGQRAMMLDIVEFDKELGDYRPVQKPKLQPACQFPAVEGQEVLADTSPHVKEARSHVQEFLLLNHPVDCPICDQAGECKLQDYWLEHQGSKKRMHDEPIHKPKGVSFGPTIVYDGERCVMCTRCVRFMEEVAMDPVLEMRERGNLNEIAVAPGRQLEGNYTFMTEHVCPVGALTTKDFRFKARVWFLRTANSVCQGCATGCNTHLDYDSRNNTAYRYRPRDNEQVNKYWMCDEGMLTYKRANADYPGRITSARLGKAKSTNDAALTEAARLLSSVPKESIAVVFSAQHSQEDNWALARFAELLGTKAFYSSAHAAGPEDKILLHRDKNPNTLGVMQLAASAKPYSFLLLDIQAARVTHVVALEGSQVGVGPDAAPLASLGGLVVLASQEGALAQAAHVVLPSASWAEASGTYVNAKGMAQVAEKAIEPLGSSLPAWHHLANLAKAMGLEPSWSKLKEIRAALTAPRGSVAPKAPSTPPNPVQSA